MQKFCFENPELVSDIAQENNRDGVLLQKDCQYKESIDSLLFCWKYSNETPSQVFH